MEQSRGRMRQKLGENWVRVVMAECFLKMPSSARKSCRIYTSSQSIKNSKLSSFLAAKLAEDPLSRWHSMTVVASLSPSLGRVPCDPQRVAQGLAGPPFTRPVGTGLRQHPAERCGAFDRQSALCKDWILKLAAACGRQGPPAVGLHGSSLPH